MIREEKVNKRFKIFDYELDLITKEEGLSCAESYIEEKKSAQVVTLNPEMIMMGEKNSDLKTSLQKADIVLPDGAGLVMAVKSFGADVHRIPGIEFSEELISKAAEHGWKVGFWGAKEDVVQKAVENLKNKYPKLTVSYVRSGYYNEEEEPVIVGDIKTAGTQILFVAMGVPKQEIVIRKYKDILGCLMIGVGGSFDVWSGRVMRAPKIFRSLGCEWLYRLLKEPNRFSRMFPSLPLFVFRVILNSNKIKKENRNVQS